VSIAAPPLRELMGAVKIVSTTTSNFKGGHATFLESINPPAIAHGVTGTLGAIAALGLAVLIAGPHETAPQGRSSCSGSGLESTNSLLNLALDAIARL